MSVKTSSIDNDDGDDDEDVSTSDIEHSMFFSYYPTSCTNQIRSNVSLLRADTWVFFPEGPNVVACFTSIKLRTSLRKFLANQGRQTTLAFK